MLIAVLVLLVAVFGGTLVLTLAAAHYVRKRQLIDVPDERRNHSQSTPRGAGLGLVISVVASLWALSYYQLLTYTQSLAISVAALLVAGVGFADDHRPLPPWVRVVIQCLATIAVLIGIQIPPQLELVAGLSLSGWVLYTAVFAGIIWMINLYNFMDGIDAIVCTELVSVCALMGALLFYFQWWSYNLSLVLVLGTAAAAFLCFNWPPAKLFMGDVCSGFLGLMMAVMALLLWRQSELLLWVWLILQLAFLVDTGVTLIHRLLRGQTLYQAHSTHAYQQAFRRYRRAEPILICLFLLKLCWLSGCAMAVLMEWVSGLSGLLISSIPLVVLAFYFKAGQVAPSRRLQ